MYIERNIVVHAICFVLGMASGSGLLYVLSFEGDNRAWILWENSTSVVGSSSVEDWTMVLAGRNKRECQKQLEVLAENQKQVEKTAGRTELDALTTTVNTVTFDGFVLTKHSNTFGEGQNRYWIANVTKTICFPETVDPRSTVSK